MQEMRANKVASQFIESLEYPIVKGGILAAARDASIDLTVQASLKKLPDREYVDAQDLTQQLNAVA